MEEESERSKGKGRRSEGGKEGKKGVGRRGYGGGGKEGEGGRELEGIGKWGERGGSGNGGFRVSLLQRWTRVMPLLPALGEEAFGWERETEGDAAGQGGAGDDAGAEGRVASTNGRRLVVPKVLQVAEGKCGGGIGVSVRIWLWVSVTERVWLLRGWPGSIGVGGSALER